MRASIGILTSIGVSALLAACGGGGSSGNNASAEGAWNGTDSRNRSLNVLVLENGDFYSIYGSNSGSNFLVQGFEQGTSTINGSTLTANVTEYTNTVATTSGTINATVVTGTSIKGTAANSAGSLSFSAIPLSDSYSSYNYSTAPVNDDVLGNWTGSLLDGSAATISISSAGGITGSNAGCSFTGTASPRSSGKNVFNMGITFGPSPCTYAGQSVSGIALDYVLSSGKRQLLAAMQDSAKTHGYMFFAQR
jgi:hypothetical protein